MSKPRSRPPASGSRPARRSLVELTAMAASAAADEPLAIKPKIVGLSPDGATAKGPVSPPAVADAREYQPRRSVDLTADIAVKAAKENLQPNAPGAAADYRAEVFEMMRANMKVTLDYVQQLVDAKAPSQFIELSGAHARKQFELMMKQTRELRSLSRTPTTPDAS